jgi:hypothetical protein
MSSIPRKLSVNDRTQAVVWAMGQDWIEMSPGPLPIRGRRRLTTGAPLLAEGGRRSGRPGTTLRDDPWSRDRWPWRPVTRPPRAGIIPRTCRLSRAGLFLTLLCGPR